MPSKSHDDALKVRAFNGHPVRSLIYQGKVWWSIKDAAKALAMDETATALFWKLARDEKEMPSVLTDRGRQYLRCCNRKGLLYLAGKSALGEAFMAWVDNRFRREHAEKEAAVEAIQRSGRAEAENRETRAAMDAMPADDTGMVTPTQIGKALAISAQQVNLLMCMVGLQTSVMDNTRKRYLLTPAGKHFGVARRVCKENGEEIGHLYWNKAVIAIVAAKKRAVDRQMMEMADAS